MIENTREIAGPWLLVLKIARWLDLPGRLAGKAAAWLFLPMILIIVFDAVGRKYLRKLDFVIANNLHGYLNSPVLQDAEWHLHAVIFLAALGFAYSRNVHVRLDIFRHKFSDRGRLWLELLGGLIILFPFLAVLLNGVVRATDLLIAGLNVVVFGFGDCGKGVAERAYGMGAKVTVVEPDSVRALEALMHGYEVKNSLSAAKIADVVVTVTGNRHVLDKAHFDVMKDGVVLSNAGHFDVEINLVELKKNSKEVNRIREHVDSYQYGDKEILVLGEGRLVNLTVATGHPASVMDMSFANQALASEWIKDNNGKLENKVYTLPKSVDQKIAATKLKLMGGELEVLTSDQVTYLDSWEFGTS